MQRLLGLWLFVCAGILPAQTNNVGAPMPASMFGFTTTTYTVTPQLAASIARSWDSGRVAWNFLNTSSGVYAWTELDKFTTQYSGKDMIYTFGLTPGWAASDPTQGTPYQYGSSCSVPANISDWDNFVTAIATHAPQIKYWELANEPMNYQYWCAGAIGSTAAFAQTALMFQHAYTILHNLVPGAVVLSPSTDKAFGLTWLTNYYANGGTNAWDVLAIHGYPDSSPEGIVAMLSSYATYMAAHGMTGMPIWDTETTSPSNGALADSAWLAKMYLLSWSSGVSRTVYYGYNLGGAMWSSTAGFSDTGTGYSSLYAWLVGATLTAACAQDGAGTYTCPIARTGYQGLIAWNSTSTVVLSAPAGMTQYRDLQGGMHSVTGGTVHVGNSPVLLETPSTTKLRFVSVGGATQAITQ